LVRTTLKRAYADGTVAVEGRRGDSTVTVWSSWSPPRHSITRIPAATTNRDRCSFATARHRTTRR
jgi:hypothetical protein